MIGNQAHNKKSYLYHSSFYHYLILFISYITLFQILLLFNVNKLGLNPNLLKIKKIAKEQFVCGRFRNGECRRRVVMLNQFHLIRLISNAF